MRSSDATGESERLVYHPAGPDDGLRAALEDLQMGRWMAMRSLLRETGADWAARTSRTQVLAAAAVRSDVVQVWQAEDSANGDVLVMQARIAVERVLQAHRQQRRDVQTLAQGAREVCWRAANAVPADPVPWVCLLALAQTDRRQALAEHRVAGPDLMLPTGPWGLLAEVHHRDPYNREAYHRMLKVLMERAGGTLGDSVDFLRWVVTWAPAGSALLVLPLYAYAEHFRCQRDGGSLDPLMRRQWTREHIARDVDRALVQWFDHVDVGWRAPLDLGHLAHGLWAANRLEDAARVFDAIGPNATKAPWASVADSAEQAEYEFLWARAQCWSRARGSPRARPTP
jgi:hypothetical protein